MDGRPDFFRWLPTSFRSFPKAPVMAVLRLGGISVLYEDEDCLIVNKPAGLLTQKASPADISLNEWLVG